MNEYENISENCRIKWHEELEIKDKKYTQVSGYIFDNDNNILIVRNKNVWTIPGGHPEKNEKPIETLKREVMEEASVTLKEIKYLGAVEVIENNETYYQLRYIARVDKIYDFKNEFETSDRKFIKLKELKKYITWSEGKTFKEQINSASKYMNS